MCSAACRCVPQAWSDVFAAHLPPRHEKQKYTSKMLLHCALIALNMKSVGQQHSAEQFQIREMIRQALQILFPVGSVTSTLESLHREGGTPSRSLLGRMRLVLDLTLLIKARETDLIPACRYAWADASPAKGHEWVWLQAVVIAEAQLLPLLEAVLHLSTYVHRSSDTNWLTEPMEAQVLELLSSLHRHMQKHSYVPVAMATSRSDLSKKAQAIAHMFATEARSWQSLRAAFHSVVSFTSDMGTELGLGAFQCSLHEVAPKWFAPAPQLNADDGEVGILPEAGLSWDELHAVSPLFPGALQVPGLQHVLDNVNREVHQSLSYWSTFFSSLKNIEHLLSQPHRRKHFVVSCLNSTCWSDNAAMVAQFRSTLYEHRWHEVASFVRNLLPLMPLLRGSWDAQKYARQNTEQGSEFSASMLSATLNNPLFGAYLHLIDLLESTCEQLAAWGEACDCHEHMYKEGRLSTFEKSSLLIKHFQGPFLGIWVVWGFALCLGVLTLGQVEL